MIGLAALAFVGAVLVAAGFVFAWAERDLDHALAFLGLVFVLGAIGAVVSTGTGGLEALVAEVCR